MPHRSRALPLAALFAAAVVGLAGPAGESPAQSPPPAKKKGDADGKNDKEGKARWEWKLLDKKGKSTQVGTFMGYLDGSIRHGKEQTQVGTATNESGSKNKLTVKFTGGPLKGGEGTLLLAERKPMVYRGDFIKADKSTVKMEIAVTND